MTPIPAVLQEMAKENLGGDCSSPSFLNDHSKQRGDQRDLSSHITFSHSLYLPFSQHVHHLVALYGSPGGFKREETHSWPGQTFDEALTMFNQVIEILVCRDSQRSGRCPSAFNAAKALGYAAFLSTLITCGEFVWAAASVFKKKRLAASPSLIELNQKSCVFPSESTA